MPAPYVSSASICPRHQCQARRESPLRRSGSAGGRLSCLIGQTHVLAAALIAAALVVSAQGQSSVTLAWDPSPGGAIAGYRLYDGVASRTYTNVISAGNVTTQAVTGLAFGVTYFFAVTAYDTNGLESDYSNEVSYTVPLPTNNPPVISLTSPANGAVFTAPATILLAASVVANGYTVTEVQFYNGATLLGVSAAAPYSLSWNDVSDGAYSLSAKAVYDSGSTVSSATANVTAVAGKPPSGLMFPADSRTISSPFIVSNGTILQPMTTVLASSGRAAYSFDIVNPGDYLITAMVSAANDGQNSLFVNIDAEPTDPLTIWDVPVSTGLTRQRVSWRGNGTADPATAQFSPKVFTLSAGAHQLIIRGREATTTLDTISIVPMSPVLQIHTAAGGSVVLNVTGQPGQAYEVMSSLNLTGWNRIGTVTLDAGGIAQFTDPAGTGLLNCYYRLQGQ